MITWTDQPDFQPRPKRQTPSVLSRALGKFGLGLAGTKAAASELAGPKDVTEVLETALDSKKALTPNKITYAEATIDAENREEQIRRLAEKYGLDDIDSAQALFDLAHDGLRTDRKPDDTARHDIHGVVGTIDASWALDALAEAGRHASHAQTGDHIKPLGIYSATGAPEWQVYLPIYPQYGDGLAIGFAGSGTSAAEMAEPLVVRMAALPTPEHMDSPASQTN